MHAGSSNPGAASSALANLAMSLIWRSESSSVQGWRRISPTSENPVEPLRHKGFRGGLAGEDFFGTKRKAPAVTGAFKEWSGGIGVPLTEAPTAIGTR